MNRVCLWQYSSDPSVNNHNETVKPISEKEDCTTAGVLGDTVDDPRLLCSLVHPGSVQDLKVCCIYIYIYNVEKIGKMYRGILMELTPLFIGFQSSIPSVTDE